MDRQVWDERYAGDDLVWSAEPNRFLVAEVEALPPGRALDIACGEGRNAVWLAERGWAATGVDFSQVGLEKARRLADARGVSVEWELADVTDYTPSPESFDLVIVMYLHLPEAPRRVAFRRAAAAVATGGTLLVVGHDITNPDEGWGGPRDPAVLYGPEAVVAALDGLEIVKAERVRRPVQTDDGEKVAIDVLVRATRPPRPKLGGGPAARK
jgi:SAM-dependent methyltransferase